jgi:hypothetical protein
VTERTSDVLGTPLKGFQFLRPTLHSKTIEHGTSGARNTREAGEQGAALALIEREGLLGDSEARQGVVH